MARSGARSSADVIDTAGERASRRPAAARQARRLRAGRTRPRSAVDPAGAGARAVALQPAPLAARDAPDADRAPSEVSRRAARVRPLSPAPVPAGAGAVGALRAGGAVVRPPYPRAAARRRPAGGTRVLRRARTRAGRRDARAEPDGKATRAAPDAARSAARARDHQLAPVRSGGASPHALR